MQGKGIKRNAIFKKDVISTSGRGRSEGARRNLLRNNRSGTKDFSPALNLQPALIQVRNNIGFKKGLIVLILSIFSFTTYAQNKPLKPVIAQIILPDNSTFKPLLYTSDAETQLENIMQWQNRAVIYVKTSDVARFERSIKKLYPEYKVVFFEHPFYDFERKYCSDKTVAREWTNIILSANLVKDPKMQQEYLNYHATQFQKWPEVSKGFCNADFQQLLVFKTGRQLMLVISIPKGKTLDELNPLTTKNNPRVDEWNKIMSKYQEGITGTKKGEVWVFFKDLDTK